MRGTPKQLPFEKFPRFPSPPLPSCEASFRLDTTGKNRKEEKEEEREMDGSGEERGEKNA